MTSLAVLADTSASTPPTPAAADAVSGFAVLSASANGAEACVEGQLLQWMMRDTDSSKQAATASRPRQGRCCQSSHYGRCAHTCEHMSYYSFQIESSHWHCSPRTQHRPQWQQLAAHPLLLVPRHCHLHCRVKGLSKVTTICWHTDGHNAGSASSVMGCMHGANVAAALVLPA